MTASLSPETLRAVLAAFPGADGAPLPSASGVTLFKLKGKMFAILATRGAGAPYVILKCDPHLAEVLREQYSGVGHRSHLDRRFWIAVGLDADVPPDEIRRLAAGSYDLIRDSLSKKQKAELQALSA